MRGLTNEEALLLASTIGSTPPSPIPDGGRPTMDRLTARGAVAHAYIEVDGVDGWSLWTATDRGRLALRIHEAMSAGVFA